ncbi:MAG: large subunit ribosomal protein L23 [Crocinitomicaceae bacterium]|jgi:large subunit ribosomal protein L23
MALFKKDSTTEVAANNDLSWVIIDPRITEKAAMISGNNVFTFNVATRANKIQIRNAVIEKYKVTPISINVINAKARKVTRRGRKAHQKGTKKAMVTLKKGDTIELA